MNRGPRYVVSVSPPGQPDGWLRLQGAGAPRIVPNAFDATYFSEEKARQWADIVSEGAIMRMTP